SLSAFCQLPFRVVQENLSILPLRQFQCQASKRSIHDDQNIGKEISSCSHLSVTPRSFGPGSCLPSWVAWPWSSARTTPWVPLEKWGRAISPLSLAEFLPFLD